jgi:integrase/recombinase XerD
MNGKAVKQAALNLLDDYFAGSRWTKGYIKEVRKSIAAFFDWAARNGKAGLHLIRRPDIVAFHSELCKSVSKRTGKPLAAATINGRYAAVKLLFSLIYRAGYIKENPTHSLKLKLREGKAWKRRPFTVDEINAFLESFDTEKPAEMRDRTMFELAYSSGLRLIELCRLSVGDIDFEKREMIVRGKFDRDRLVPLSEVARDFLVLYLGRRIGDRDSPVFPGTTGANRTKSGNVSAHFYSLLKRKGMKKPELSAHSIRHSTATHLLDNGASIRHVQELLGHRDIGTTERYTHVQTDGIAKIYRKYHPREHELFEAVDGAYRARLDGLLATEKHL